jgi:hypothetical protein
MRKLVVTENMTVDGVIAAKLVDEYRLFVSGAVLLRYASSELGRRGSA